MTPTEAAESLLNGNYSVVRAWIKKCKKADLLNFIASLVEDYGISPRDALIKADHLVND